MVDVGEFAPPIDVRPVFGLPVRSGGRPLVVLFLRPLSGGLARAALAQAEKALPVIEAAGGSIVAFTVADLPLARDVVPRNHVLVPVVAETNFERFDTWGLGRDRGLVRSLPALLKPATGRALRASFALGRGRPQGGLDRLPGWFMLDREGRITHVHRSDTIWELPDPEALCAALPR